MTIMKIMCLYCKLPSVIVHSVFGRMLSFCSCSGGPGHRQHDRKTSSDCGETQRDVWGIQEEKRSPPRSICQHNRRRRISLNLQLYSWECLNDLFHCSRQCLFDHAGACWRSSWGIFSCRKQITYVFSHPVNVSLQTHLRVTFMV